MTLICYRPDKSFTKDPVEKFGKSKISRAGYSFSQKGMYFVQHAAAICTIGKLFPPFAFFTGALDQITDFKVESVFKSLLFFI